MKIIPGKGVRHVVPQKVDKPGIIPLTFRVKKPKENIILCVLAGEKELLREKIRWVNPANMIKIDVNISDEIMASAHNFEVTIDG